MKMTEKFDIYQVDADNIWPKTYGSWNDHTNAKSVIYLFGRDENRKKVLKRINNFYPYFYVNAENIPSLHKYIKSITPTDKVNFKGEKLFKLEAVNSKVVPELRKELEKLGIEHFSADVLYRINFSLTHYKDLAKQGIGFDLNKCRILTVDIETTSNYESIDTINVPENIICITIHDNYTNKYHTFIWRKDFEKMNEFDGDKVVHFHNSEVSMLNHFIQFWSELQPDMVASFNGDNFDLPYIINRSKKLGVDVRGLSPIKRVWDWPEVRNGETYHNINILGVVPLDIYHWFKEVALGEQRSYSLGAIAEAEGLGIKGKVSAQQEWERDWKELIKYNVQDVYLTKAIMEKRRILDFVGGIRKVALCNITDLYYFSRAVDCLALQKAQELNLVLPTKPEIINYKSKEEREENFVGAMVLAKQGIYENVGCFDFSSLYPSIISTFNLSYETYNFNGEGIEIEIPRGTEEKDKMKIWIRQDKKGVLPQIIEKLIGLRAKYEEGLKNSKTTKEAADYDSVIQAVKNLICVVFGAQANESFRLYKREGAAIITTFGRELIGEVKRYLESKKLDVVLCDTDSAYVTIGECNIEKGKELEKELNEHIKEWVEQKWGIKKEENKLFMKFEKLIKSMIVDKKKRYAILCCWKKGRSIDDKTSIVGFNAKRSDCSLQVEYLQTKVIDMILRKESIENIEKEIFSEIEKIKSPLVYSWFGVPVRLGKDKYVNDIPKERAKNYSKEFLGVTYMVGMKPMLLYLKHKECDCVLFDDDKQLEGKEIILDKEKMIDRSIFLPLESILTIYKGENYYLNLKGRILNYLRGQKTL